MKLSEMRIGPSRPKSKFFAIADLVVWGFTMCSSGFQLLHGMLFGGKPGWWLWIQIPLFLFQFWMFKRALDGWLWFMDTKRESVDR